MKGRMLRMHPSSWEISCIPRERMPAAQRSGEARSRRCRMSDDARL